MSWTQLKYTLVTQVAVLASCATVLAGWTALPDPPMTPTSPSVVTNTASCHCQRTCGANQRIEIDVGAD